METHFWHCCIVISLVINYSTAKPFSLNEAIAVEFEQKQITENISKLPEKTTERFPLKKVLKQTSTRSSTLNEPGNVLFKTLSPLKYRRKFEIKSPLKPKYFKRSLKSKLRRKNQSVKREINGNDELKQKYIPLLKNIGILFDNLFLASESDSYEIRSRKYKRNRPYPPFSEERNGMECTCNHQSNNKHAKSKAPEKGTIFETAATKISTDSENVSAVTIAAEATNNITVGDLSGVGLHQNVSLLLSRDTNSSWRNDNGFSERNGASYNRGVEGNFTWNNGNSEYSTQCRQNKSVTKNNNEITCNAPRNGTSSDGSHERRRRNGNNSRNPYQRFTFDESDVTAEYKDFFEDRHALEHKREDKFDMGGNKTKSAKSLSELIRRLRAFISEIEVNNSSDTTQSKKVFKESIINVPHNNTSFKRFSDGSGTNTEEDKKNGTRNETMILNKTSINTDTKSDISVKAQPALMIIGGYSVTRLKNGENKISGNAIHIHS